MSITSRGIKYYPGIPFQASFAQDILVAAYPFLELAIPAVPLNWASSTSHTPNKYGRSVFEDLQSAFIEDCACYLDGGRPVDQHGNRLYCGQPRGFWVEAMAALHYWRTEKYDPFENLIISWEVSGSWTSEVLAAPPCPARVSTITPLLPPEPGAEPVYSEPILEHPSSSDTFHSEPWLCDPASPILISSGPSESCDIGAPMSTFGPRESLDPPWIESPSSALQSRIHSETSEVPPKLKEDPRLLSAPLKVIDLTDWQPCVQPSYAALSIPYGIPQGLDWYGKKVAKLFLNPSTGRLQIYRGIVDYLTISAEGQGCLHLTYEDGMEEIAEVENMLPWLLYPTGWTHLEETSGLDPNGLDRREFILFTMLTYPDGYLSNTAKLLIDQDPAYGYLLYPKPRFRSTADLFDTGQPKPKLTDGPPGRIISKGKAFPDPPYFRFYREYARRRRPPDWTAGKLLVGALCKVSNKTRTSRWDKQIKAWEPETYRVGDMDPTTIFLHKQDDPGGPLFPYVTPKFRAVSKSC